MEELYITTILSDAEYRYLGSLITNSSSQRRYNSGGYGSTGTAVEEGILLDTFPEKLSLLMQHVNSGNCASYAIRMCYIGNTQQKLKLRINQHLGEVCNLVNKGKTSDSFAKNFAIHQQDRTIKLAIGEAHKRANVSILWQGNPISCNKSFRKLNCSLCMKE